MVLETDHIVETSIKITIGEEETTAIEVVIGIIVPIIGIKVGPEIRTVTEMVTGITIDQITEEKTVIRGVVIETKTMADQGIEIEEIGGIGVAPEKAPNPEAVHKIDTRIRRQSRDDIRNGDRSESRSRSSSHVRTNRDRSNCYRCNEYDHSARRMP